MFEFRVDTTSGVAPYRQIVEQVRHGLRLGLLEVGDQLPTVKEVVAMVAINPNTVSKAYRELELEGLLEGRAGVGTFVVDTLAGPSLAAHGELRRSLTAWIDTARRAGLDDASISALFENTLVDARRDGVA
jgi:DNA-binding transcriptional regulator YhcF (GntR family)